MSPTSVASPPAGSAPSRGVLPGPTGRPAGSRRITRPTALPGTRAVLGAFLVTASALTAFVVARHDGAGPTGAPVAVATRSLEPGTVLSAGDVRLVVLDLPPAVAAAGFSSTDGLVGAVLRGPVGAGAPVDRATVATAPDGLEAGLAYREVSFAVPRSRALDGRVRPGDRVDVVRTTDTETSPVVQHATVLAVGGPDGALAVSDDVVLTLALPDPGDAIAVADGAARGELTVLGSTRAGDDLPDRYRPGPDPSSTAGSGAAAGGAAVVVTGASS